MLFDGVSTPGESISNLKQLLDQVPASKKRAIMQHMTRAMIPIIEKALLHPPMVHRYGLARVAKTYCATLWD